MTRFEEMGTGVKCADEYRIDTRNNISVFDCATFCATVSRVLQIWFRDNAVFKCFFITATQLRRV